MVLLSGGGVISYTWSGGVTKGTPFPISSTTTFTVTGTNSGGCTNIDTIIIVVNVCTGIGRTSSNENFIIYPNPGNGIMNLEYRMEYKIQIMR